MSLLFSFLKYCVVQWLIVLQVISTPAFAKTKKYRTTKLSFTEYNQRINEYMRYASTLEEFVKILMPHSKLRTEALAFLKREGLSTKQPGKVNFSAQQIRVKDGNKTYTFPVSMRSDNKVVTLNGVQIDLYKRSLEDIYQDVRKALNRKKSSSAHMLLGIQEAHAFIWLIAAAVVVVLAGGYASLSWYDTCREDNSPEDDAWVGCPERSWGFRSNQDNIKNTLREEGRITSLTCDSKNKNRIQRVEQHIKDNQFLKRRYSYRYTKDGKLSHIVTMNAADNQVYCNYKVDPGKGVVVSASGPDKSKNCNKNLRDKDIDNISFGWPKAYPHKRLIECCPDESCRNSVQDFTGQHSSDVPPEEGTSSAQYQRKKPQRSSASEESRAK